MNSLMTNVLEDGANSRITRLLPEQQILNLAQGASLTIINEMIPTTRIPVQHRLSLENLFPIRFTALTLERIMRIARRVRFELKQLTQGVEREMPFDILGRVDNTGRK